ncbi:MAG: hypothetical protein P8169_11355 [Chloroflexota bacterium]
MRFEENLDEEKFDALLARLRAEAEDGTEEPSVVEKISAYARK